MLQNQVFGPWEASPLVVDGDHVPDPAAQRRARGGCKDRPDLLDLQASRRAGLQGVLRRQQSRAGDPRRHAVHGHARRTPRRRQCPQRPSPLEREGRRACPRILRQPGAARREGQSDRRRWRRRIRSQGIHRGVRAGDGQGDLALQHGARSRRARLRDLERRRMEDRRRIALGHGLVRSRVEPDVLGHRQPRTGLQSGATARRQPVYRTPSSRSMPTAVN